MGRSGGAELTMDTDESPVKEIRPKDYSMVRIVVPVACIAAVIGITVGLCLHFLLPGEDIPVPDTLADCMPQGTLSRDACMERGCLWKEREAGPWCLFPQGYGYKMDGDPEQTPLGYRVNLQMTPRRMSLYSDDVTSLTLHVEFHTKSRLRIKFADSEGVRYEVPREAVDIPVPTEAASETARLYNVTFVEEPQFGIKVTRRETGAVIFSTSVPGFTFSDQYIQLTTRLNSSHVYGFGEHNHRRFKHDMNWKKWTIFTRDVAPVDEWNLYGAQPMYMNLEEDGKANAVLLLNSNAMDIVLQPDPHPGISYHVIGGILDFYVFLGPSPENVVQQYTEATGRPLMPPYWSLGFQLSRWDYDNLTHVRNVVDRNRAAGIPQDVQYGDIDYMESKFIFTYDHVKYDGLPDFVEELHSRGQKYIIILDPGIGTNQTIIDNKLSGSYPPYTDGVSQDIFVRDGRNSTQYLQGEVWPGPVVYPDFTKVRDATAWWQQQCEDFHQNQGVTYDALWIDMNEVSSFVPGSSTGCDKNKLNYPPYMPNILGGGDGHLYDKTICMDAIQAWGKQYDVHSLYGHSMSIVTWHTLKNMFPEERPLVLTRSQFTGSQKYAMHWLGDNQSQWRQVPWSIVGMLEYSLFGFTYTGADVCGFWFEATEELCQRWMQLGAFYPFSRNHNGAGWRDQDPANFSPEMTRVSRNILLTRYKLLPYLYTLFYNAHVHGDTVVRPMLHEFTSDKKTWAVDRQFLWGPAFLITPVMTQATTEVEGYFPRARWYDYYTGEEMQNTGETKTLYTPMDKINLHVRGGYVIPWQEPANTTFFSRQNPMGITVALGEPSGYAAQGTLFWDDGHSIGAFDGREQYLKVEFECENFQLKFNVVHKNYADGASLVFDTVDIWGLPRQPMGFKVDGTDTPFVYEPYSKSVTLESLGLGITLNHTITWDISN